MQKLLKQLFLEEDILNYSPTVMCYKVCIVYRFKMLSKKKDDHYFLMLTQHQILIDFLIKFDFFYKKTFYFVSVLWQEMKQEN